MKATNMRMAVSGAVMVLAGVASVPVMADFTGNVGATSNYVWRGLTQTDNTSAISGGLDYSHDSGIYLGTWVSNTAFSSEELDLYAGFSKEFGDLGLDVGVINYAYPQYETVTGNPSVDWNEVYVGVSYKQFGLQVSSTSDFAGTDTDAMYIEASADFEVATGLSLGIHVGSYDFDVPAAAGYDDYTDYSISLSKDEFTFAVSDTDLDEALFPSDADMKYTISWAKEFDLLK